MKSRRKSLRFQWIFSILAMFVGMLVFIILYSFYIVQSNKKEMCRTLMQNVKFQMDQLERNLEEVEDFLIEQNDLKVEYMEIVNHKTELDYYIAQNNIRSSFRSALGDYDNVDGFYLYHPPDGLFVSAIQDDVELKPVKLMKNRLFSIGMNYYQLPREEKNNWLLLNTGEEEYLIKIMENYGSYVGSFVRAGRLSENFEMLGAAYVCDKEGVPLKKPDEENIWSEQKGWNEGSYVLLEEESSLGPFSIAVLVKQRAVTENGKGYLGYLAMGMLLLFAMGLFISYQFRYQFADPLQRLMDRMSNAGPDEAGSWTVKEECEEFQRVYDTMDEMVLRIYQLNQEIYEERIQKQQVSIQYLQLQINPHFLINCVDLVRNLIYMKQEKQAETVIVEVGKYMRYVMRSHNWVSLSDELEHVRTYVRIQKVRYNDFLEYEEEIQEGANEMQIPIMLVQTFVENSVKHQGGQDSVLKVGVKAHINGDFLEIFIQDNGEGFEPGILDKLTKKEVIFNEYGEHVGIYNVCRRLEILYGNQAEIRFANGEEKGAQVSVFLPVKEMKISD